MKQFLIIPLGGLGSRFEREGYKTYKPFLPISSKLRIIDNIISNFPQKDTHVILIANNKKYNFIKLNFKRKNTTIIKINNHKFGPMHSLFLAIDKIKRVVKKNSFYVSYSDINWKWDFKKVEKIKLKKKIIVFSHKGFHPHLETDEKSDFFLCNKNSEIKRVSEKKIIKKDYKKNYLAIGCYYFESLRYFEFFFNLSFFKKPYLKREIYLINFLEYCLKRKIKINHYLIDKFVHLGTPSQYENFLQWKKFYSEAPKKSLKLNLPGLMLMAGQGKRVKNLREKKPFLQIRNYKAYEFIFNKFGSSKKIIVINRNFYKSFGKKYKLLKIEKTNSMFETVENSLSLIKDLKNFFIHSCDCFGLFNKKRFINFLKNKKPDVVLFAFNISNLQRKLSNAHTTIRFKNNSIYSINIKKLSNKSNELGHAGFFWISSKKVFDHVKNFHKTKKFNREILLDDYFKFLFDKKLCTIKCFKLDQYIHFGSIPEYFELKYWENFFKNDNL